jgi:hypothetical protein
VIALSKRGEGKRNETSGKKSSSQAAPAEDKKRTAIVQKVLGALKSEQTTNDYIVTRLKGLAGALGKYPRTNSNATDDFFKVATATDEDRKFKQAGGKGDESSQQCQQFKTYTHLILDLCDSMENGDHELAVKGQPVTLTTYINAVNEQIASFEKRQAEIDSRITKLAKPPAGSGASTSSNPSQDGGNHESNKTLLCRRFLQVKPGDSRELYKFIRYNPERLEEESIKSIWSMGAQAIDKGEHEYAKSCFYHWRSLSDCLPLGPFYFFQAIMAPTCDVSVDFQNRAMQEYTQVPNIHFASGRCPLNASGTVDPDVEY